MLEFVACHASTQRCEESVRVWRWPEVCLGRCTSSSVGSNGCTSERPPYQCSLACLTRFSSPANLRSRPCLLAMYHMTQANNRSRRLELKRHGGVSFPRAWLLKHKIMQVRGCASKPADRPPRDPRPGRQCRSRFVRTCMATQSGQSVLMCLSRWPFTRDSIQALTAKLLVAPAALDPRPRLLHRRAWHWRPSRAPRHWRRGQRQSPALIAANTVLDNIKCGGRERFR